MSRYLDIDVLYKLWNKKGVFEKLEEKYKKEILERFNWENIKEEMNEHEGKVFIGSVFSMFPSGKFYMPWTTNQSAKGVLKDEVFSDVLDEILSEKDMWWENSEADPCNIFFCGNF